MGQPAADPGHQCHDAGIYAGAHRQPILAQSQGTLRWIVIDEAHNYISQAAELTLLLRRVLHAFGCRAEDVHFVATSATIFPAGDTTEERLREFLTDIAGVSSDRVSVIFGQRQVPLPEALCHAQQPLPALDTLGGLAPQELFQVLAAAPRVRQLRSALIQRARPLRGGQDGLGR